MMEAVGSSKTLEITYMTTQCHNQADHYLTFYCHKILKFYVKHDVCLVDLSSLSHVAPKAEQYC